MRENCKKIRPRLPDKHGCTHHAVGGSWLCPKKEIAAGNFDAITALCREASAIAREADS